MIGRTSAFAYRGRRVPPEQMRASWANHPLTGSVVRRDDEALRISAELIDADTGVQLWAGATIGAPAMFLRFRTR